MDKNLKSKATSPTRPDFLREASGPVAIRMTNDYLFHAMLQKDNEALKGLVGALLRLRPEQIVSADITNPIELGAYIEDKEFVLDVKLLLNSSAVINIELQVINRKNWPERSLSYLCRSFDGLNPAESYSEVKPAMHIGLLDFTLFPEFPEFYATYRMMNVKNHIIYSDKLCLSVVDLTHIDLATEEDRLHHIDRWAALFKATTWEDIKMIAQNDAGITNAANTVWKLSQEDKIRLRCEAREDYYRNERDVQLQMKKKDSTIAEQAAVIEEKEAVIAEQAAAIEEKDTALAEQAAAIEEKDAVIAALKAALEKKPL